MNNNIQKSCVGIPCFGGEEKLLCISPHNMMRCTTQCPFQCPPCLISSICSLVGCSKSNFPFSFCFVVNYFMGGKCKLTIVVIVGLHFCGFIFHGCSAPRKLGKNGCTHGATKLLGLRLNQGEENPANCGNATWWYICGNGRKGCVVETFDVSKNSLVFAWFSISPTR